ncbi:MAG: hypothetical protein ACD_44C00417G0002 [uncultured bacterium]|nr:MAG: hypothetical protein ACD_44C00417G0002 [uncultured bacterium]OGT16533.1 MAG: hypothetical protein A3B69_03970 [Gammaproteobacteria bacterium RIFCSPHIGHO2_02_FULL_38_33]OGT24854.1 MAG: hypothetical protein A2W47_02085 [Gammaproteobacteria bacterium RIFCSPHIGHO2_12_38_15]OGT69479.1 MAG: hypothetical protein A3I12_02565 [Gammaproteobacteria bacterium RIFCSPLOWO2_02_FULL_38_11]OGT76911.1 MAG: hypothetical protein A3G71_05790 [Gammaproteobacteria bacterium RIFCSPLOWO2_12_FULL_38_14]
MRYERFVFVVLAPLARNAKVLQTRRLRNSSIMGHVDNNSGEYISCADYEEAAKSCAEDGL